MSNRAGTLSAPRISASWVQRQLLHDVALQPGVRNGCAPLCAIGRPCADRSEQILLIAKGDFIDPASLTEIRAEFDLSAREGELAREIMLGKSPDQAAEALGITSATAKVHLHNIFVKTETHRQTELAQLLWNTFTP